jgi:hypothetical protein
MTLRTKPIASACAALALGLAWAATAQPALARYHFHNSSVGEMITSPPGGTRAQTYAAAKTDRLSTVKTETGRPVRGGSTASSTTTPSLNPTGRPPNLGQTRRAGP